MKEVIYVAIVAALAIAIASPVRDILDGLSRPILLVFIDDQK